MFLKLKNMKEISIIAIKKYGLRYPSCLFGNKNKKKYNPLFNSHIFKLQRRSFSLLQFASDKPTTNMVSRDIGYESRQTS